MAVETVLEASDDLRELRMRSPELLAVKKFQKVIRYMAGPPISDDDWMTIAETTLAPTLIAKDPDRARRLTDIVLHGLDQERFPWVSEDREPTEEEREAAVVATAGMMALRGAETDRRTNANKAQETALKEFLVSECGFREVPTRRIDNMTQAPPPGHFMGETIVATRKADVPIRLWDGRLMPVECKVSGSSTNSVKRVANDAASKASTWLRELGTVNCVPTALMGGVFSLTTLEFCQAQGLVLFWDHDLEALKAFVDSTR